MPDSPTFLKNDTPASPTTSTLRRIPHPKHPKPGFGKRIGEEMIAAISHSLRAEGKLK